MSYTYKTLGNYPEEISGQLIQNILRKEDEAFIPLDEENYDYQTYLKDIQTNGMSIVEVSDCRNGVPDKSMWQYADNAEELLVNKYGSDQDKLTALREDRYVRAMEAKTPYESMSVASPVINATPQDIKDKNRHLPMRR
tara:strand:+ start:241 stop:657 length:417 start_codon:yes stop_codon:yes gene_type:complete